MKKTILPTHSLFVSLMLLLALPHLSSAQQEDTSREIDRIFEQFKKTDRPGCSVVIVKNGEVVYKNGFGMANLEYGVPITSGTVFDIASVSKQFAGVAISTLVQEGKISLDDDIRKYLPDVPDFGHKITIRHLVHHTSGIRDWPEALRIAGWRWDEVISFDDIMRMVKYQRDLDFNPGERYSYSNTGYNLLAAIVAKASGKTFSQWTDEQIFKPLNMSSSWFQDDYTKPVKNLAYSYSPGEGGYRKVPGSLTAYGSSSLFTSAEDLGKWVIHFDKQIAVGNPVYTNMLKPGQLNNGEKVDYAFGLARDEERGIKTVSHTGGWQGYRTILLNYPEEKLSLILLSNAADFNIARFSAEVSEVFLKDKWKKDEKGAANAGVGQLPTVALNTSLARKYVGTYELGPGWTVAVTLENGALMVQAVGEPKFPVQPKSDSTVWIEAYGASMTFVKDQKGEFNLLRYKDIKAKRVKIYPVDKQSFGGLAGTYYSPEFFTEYKVDVAGGKVTMYHMRNGDLVLTPDATGADRFSSNIGTVQFTRNAQQSVTGLTFSGGRVKNLRFDKR
ncbi:serine hydrolase domain-containing protein [Dyadobacter crusticola]|uniref:serine hydrolase domain-containing protein n=1 Tax=Dyadobacter crusticola TaxID=292407 RepID=UPI000556937E|nr:serine hydrolase domain-containing protein [Dyadobacter crusticola]